MHRYRQNEVSADAEKWVVPRKTTGFSSLIFIVRSERLFCIY